MRPPLNVLITVDTEVWPLTPDWRETCLAEDVRRDIYGLTTEGEYGLLYQLEVLRAHGLKASFFVEPLFAFAIGPKCLQEIIAAIQGRGHEVQLHPHPEWLAWMPKTFLPGRVGELIRDYSEDDQSLIVAESLKMLRSCGATGVCAFRAGDYAANFDTLRALGRNGIAYDTSYNFCYLGSTCGLDVGEPVLHPRRIEGVYEFPIGFFRDWPGHYRHAQVCACSAQEMKSALQGALRHGWSYFIIVLHSFELLRGRRQPNRQVRPDRVLIRRFETLCRFLGENREKFRTMGFSQLDPPSVTQLLPARELRSSIVSTTLRCGEQLIRRLQG